MCARRVSTAPATRCSRSTCPTAGSKSTSAGWCRGPRAGSCWAMMATASPSAPRGGWPGPATPPSRSSTALRPLSPDAAAAAAKRAEAVAARYGIRAIDHRTLAEWQSEAETRTTYLLDVRSPDEFAAGRLPGSVSAPGGQLVQAIDRWVGIRGARLVLVDDKAVRAVMTAQWLKQMGWDACVLDHPFDGAALETGEAMVTATLP